jgi:hypothetical protein
MSYQPDDRHERDVLPPRIATSNVTLDKEKYDKNSIRSPQPTGKICVTIQLLPLANKCKCSKGSFVFFVRTSMYAKRSFGACEPRVFVARFARPKQSEIVVDHLQKVEISRFHLFHLLKLTLLLLHHS